MVDKYSITKDPSATKLSVSKDIDATPVIITKQPGNTRAYLTKNPGGTKVRLVKNDSGAGVYNQYQHTFDGATDRMSLDISAAGWTENDWILSWWMTVDGLASGNDCAIAICKDGLATGCAFLDQHDAESNHLLQIRGKTSTDWDTVESATSGGTPIAQQGEIHHCLASYDASAQRLFATLYNPTQGDVQCSTGVLGVALQIATGSGAGLIDTFRVGSRGTASRFMDGDVGDVFFKIGSGIFVDVHNAAEIAKFRDASNNPIDPGSDGSGYGHGAADVMLSTDTAWTTGANQGALGGTFV